MTVAKGGVLKSRPAPSTARLVLAVAARKVVLTKSTLAETMCRDLRDALAAAKPDGGQEHRPNAEPGH